MTHADLVERAYRWLLSFGCGFAFKEFHGLTYEIPDAIGFKWDTSILIECKATRADFLSDKKKHFRKCPELGMGDYRFYMAPQYLIKSNELPEKWGLLEVVGRKVLRTVNPYGKGNYFSNGFTEKNHRHERTLLISACRRLHLRGVLPLIYDRVT